jgi:hypothetical protein
MNIAILSVRASFFAKLPLDAVTPSSSVAEITFGGAAHAGII